MNHETKTAVRDQHTLYVRLLLGTAALLAAAGFALAATPVLVTVGDAGNDSDVTTFGAVDHAYRIGVNEVTRTEYAAFLNAVAASDPHGLYNPNMGITRTGSPGSYVYAATDGARSVAWVSWYDALRFANWLHNGQPSGAQGAASTETGAYTFSGETTVSGRSPNALVFLPDENEWYKAAYYQGGQQAWYWAYPTRSDTPPKASLPSAGDNAANFDRVMSGPTAVDAYPATQGYYGTRDQAGNLWEWNESEVDGDRGLRGGSYDDYPLLLHAHYRDSQNPSLENEFVGFRIAATSSATSPANQPPVAEADSYTVDEAVALTVGAPGVLANDTDGDDNVLTAVLVTGPAHGTLALNADGSFAYTPAGNFNGEDSFSYKPSDGLAEGNTVKVTVTVRAVFYGLTVIGGSGGGSYAFGSIVNIQANAAPAGKVFDRWTGDTAYVANVASASTTITMQRSLATVTATYKSAPNGQELTVTVAEWNSRARLLTIAGRGPPRAKVVITDLAGGKIGTATVKSDGTWKLRVLRSSTRVPSGVRATCNGMTVEINITRK